MKILLNQEPKGVKIDDLPAQMSLVEMLSRKLQKEEVTVDLRSVGFKYLRYVVRKLQGNSILDFYVLAGSYLDVPAWIRNEASIPELQPKIDRVNRLKELVYGVLNVVDIMEFCEQATYKDLVWMASEIGIGSSMEIRGKESVKKTYLTLEVMSFYLVREA